jgi:hypothetical protein
MAFVLFLLEGRTLPLASAFSSASMLQFDNFYFGVIFWVPFSIFYVCRWVIKTENGDV